MQCLFCGKRLSLVKRMGSARFCTSEHEERFRREQEEAALALLLDARTDAASVELPEPVLTAEFSEPEEPAVSLPSRADFLINASRHRAAVSSISATAPGRVAPSWTAGRQAAIIPFSRAMQATLGVPDSAALWPSQVPRIQIGAYVVAEGHGAILSARFGLFNPIWKPASGSTMLLAPPLTAIRLAPVNIAAVYRGFEGLYRASLAGSRMPLFSRDRFIPFFADLLSGGGVYPLAEAVPLPPPQPSIPPDPAPTTAPLRSRLRIASAPRALASGIRDLRSRRTLAEAPRIVLSPGSAVAPEAALATASPLEARPSQLARLASRVNATSFGYLGEGGLTKLAAAAAASGACPTWNVSSGLAFAGPSIARPASRLRVDSESVPPISGLARLAALQAVPPATPTAKLTPMPVEAVAPSTPKIFWKLTAAFNASPWYPISTRAASSHPEPRLVAVPFVSVYKLPAARIRVLVPGFARLTALHPVAMPRPAHLKRTAMQLGLEAVEQRPVRPTTCPEVVDLLTGDGRSGGWRRHVHMPESIRVPQSWRSLSREVRWAALALPVLIGLWMKLAPSGAPPPAPVVSQQAAESGDVGFLNAGLQSIRENISRRAAVELFDDFRSGLSGWEGDGDWAKTWAYDAAGFIRPGQMAIYEPTRDLVNYRFEFVGQIEKRGMSWTVRSADLRNYYAFRLFISKPGPVPGISLARWAVISGKEDKLVQLPLPHNVRNDTIYQIRVDLQGSNVTTYVQGQVSDTWSDRRLKAGGVGLFMTRGDQARFRSVAVTHQYDALGRLCAFLVPPGGIQHNGSLKQ